MICKHFTISEFFFLKKKKGSDLEDKIKLFGKFNRAKKRNWQTQLRIEYDSKCVGNKGIKLIKKGQGIKKENKM